MEHNNKLKLRTPHVIIRDAMKKEGLDYVSIAERIGESRPDKLSVAVRCTNGIGPRAIEMRKKIAEALSLDPEEVWDKIYLQERPRGKGGYSAVPAASQIDGKEWAQMSPSARVRALLKEQDMTVQDLADQMSVSYRVLTNNIYGSTADHSLRFRIAEFLDSRPVRIWPELYGSLKARKAPLNGAFLGFGDMTKPIYSMSAKS